MSRPITQGSGEAVVSLDHTLQGNHSVPLAWVAAPDTPEPQGLEGLCQPPEPPWKVLETAPKPVVGECWVGRCQAISTLSAAAPGWPAMPPPAGNLHKPLQYILLTVRGGYHSKELASPHRNTMQMQINAVSGLPSQWEEGSRDLRQKFTHLQPMTACPTCHS